MTQDGKTQQDTCKSIASPSTVTRTIKEWSDDAVEKLKRFLDCTDWDVFVDSLSDTSELSQCADILISV